jgi:hypothetical protein
VLAKRQTSAPVRISVRYYLCTDAAPVRLPLRLCRDLADRVIALPRFANSIQRMVEVLIQSEPNKIKSNDVVMRKRRNFKADGRLTALVSVPHCDIGRLDVTNKPLGVKKRITDKVLRQLCP